MTDYLKATVKTIRGPLCCVCLARCGQSGWKRTRHGFVCAACAPVFLRPLAGEEVTS